VQFLHYLRIADKSGLGFLTLALLPSVEMVLLAFYRSGQEQIQLGPSWPPTIQPTLYLLARLSPCTAARSMFNTQPQILYILWLHGCVLKVSMRNIFYDSKDLKIIQNVEVYCK
jgi:hypothetical protein